jgi:hypothetical protein
MTEGLQTLMGLLLLLGVTKSRNLSINEIWEKGGLGINFIQSGMSQKRFSFLLCALHFDNIMDRQQSSAVDNIVPVSYIFERLILNCQKNYKLGAMTTTDEQPVGFRRRCRFHMYMPKNQQSMGLKYMPLCMIYIFT